MTGSMQVAMKYSTPGCQDIGKVLRNLKMRGQPSFLGFKSSSVSLNLEMRVMDSKSLSGSLVRKPKLVCKCFGSQDQRLASLIRKLTPKYEVFPTVTSYVTRMGIFSTLVFLAFILVMFFTRRYQIEFLPRLLKMKSAIASDVTVVISTILIFVICGVMDIMNLKPNQIVFTAGLASLLFSLVGKKIFESISCAMLFHKQLNVGDLIRVNSNDSEVTGNVESIGLMSPLLIRDLSGEVHSIPNDKFAGSVYVKMNVGTFRIISFRFVVSQNMIHKIDDIITNVDKILKKFVSHENEQVPNCACVEAMDDNLKDIKILVSCLVQVNDLKEYLQIKGAIITEVSKLLADVNSSAR